MKNRIWLWIMIASLGLNVIFGLFYCIRHSNNTGILHGIGRFVCILQLVRRNYYDKEKVQGSKLIDIAITGMLDSLDPWSKYLLPNEKNMADVQKKGVYSGVGITYTATSSGYRITSLAPDAPAAKAGLQINDVIISVENQPVTGNNPTSQPQLNGKPGTSVHIQILRGTNKMNFTLVREEIKVPVVRHCKVLKQDIGFFQLTLFSDTTMDNVKKALENLKAQNIKGLIIDLRNNPGGTVESATEVCSFFLNEHQLVISMKKRLETENMLYYTKPVDFHWPQTIPVVLLVNQDTASAAEIMSGCLKDYKKATLVGTKTFGKAVAQSLYEFKDGYALTLTTSQFYTPKSNGQSIHNIGIEPEVTVKITPEQQKELTTLYNTNQMPPIAKDPQLLKAWEILTHPQKPSPTKMENIK